MREWRRQDFFCSVNLCSCTYRCKHSSSYSYSYFSFWTLFLDTVSQNLVNRFSQFFRQLFCPKTVHCSFCYDLENVNDLDTGVKNKVWWPDTCFSHKGPTELHQTFWHIVYCKIMHKRFFMLIKKVDFSWRPSWKTVFRIANFLSGADINSVPVPITPILGSRYSELFLDFFYL